VLRELPCQCFTLLAKVTSGTSRFLWTMATRLSQCHENFLGDLVRRYETGQALANLGKSSKQNGLPRRARPLNRKFQQNGFNLWGT